MAKNGKLASFVSSLSTDPIGIEEHQFITAQIWSERIRTFACRYQKPMPYHLAMLHTVAHLPEGGKEKQGSKNEPCKHAEI